MNILLRETENKKIVALHPGDGTAMTRIIPGVWCANDELSTEYEHVEGIFWNSMSEAKKQLKSKGHKIILD